MPNDGDTVPERAVERVPERLNYPIEEAAILLGLSESTIRRRVDSGALRAIYDGGRRLVPCEALAAYRSAQTDQPAQQHHRRKTQPAARAA